MFPHAQSSGGIPPDKLMQQLLIQAIQSFYSEDYENGVYYLQQIRANLPKYMYQLSPAFKILCKDIVKIIQAGSIVSDSSDMLFPAHVKSPTESPSSTPISPPQEQPLANQSSQSSPLETQKSQSLPSESVSAPDLTTKEPSETEITTETKMTTEFVSELSSKVAGRKDKKKRKISEDLSGSLDDLEEFDF